MQPLLQDVEFCSSLVFKKSELFNLLPELLPRFDYSRVKTGSYKKAYTIKLRH